jgi:hypothetical protein
MFSSVYFIISRQRKQNDKGLHTFEKKNDD